MRFKLSTQDYARLAEFRHALRGFTHFSEAAAAEVGLTTQHYQAMLVLRACPEDRRITIVDLAHALLIKHNSAVGLVDRLVQERLIVREHSTPTGARSNCASPAAAARYWRNSWRCIAASCNRSGRS